MFIYVKLKNFVCWGICGFRKIKQENANIFFFGKCQYDLNLLRQRYFTYILCGGGTTIHYITWFETECEKWKCIKTINQIRGYLWINWLWQISNCPYIIHAVFGLKILYILPRQAYNVQNNVSFIYNPMIDEELWCYVCLSLYASECVCWLMEKYELHMVWT